MTLKSNAHEFATFINFTEINLLFWIRMGFKVVV